MASDQVSQLLSPGEATSSPGLPAALEPALEATGRPGWAYAATKRLLDIVLASVGLVLVAPILAAAAIAIRLDTPGPALFRQERVGRGGRPFTMVKFRGMHVDAKQRFPELYEYSYEGAELTTLRFHPERDPRVTRVGRFLRKTSIDELPNLINVLQGDMALVGPRPEIPEMLPYYGEAATVILSVKPGVTSLAKVSGRDELTFGETLDLDVEYVRRRSLWLDLLIMLRTVVSVARQEGVH